MIVKKPISQLGYSFVDPKYLKKGENEYYLRDKFLENGKRFRNLSASEIEELVRNRNTSDNWNNIFVSDKFSAKLVRDCQFFGVIRIGDLEEAYLEYHDLKLPVGLYSSKIISCDFSDNVAIENVNYLAHYQIGKESAIQNVNEMACSSHAKFGNGILKEGEEEKIRIWLELCNENGGRSILPFDGLLPGDAALWTKYRADNELLDKFKEFTASKFDDRRGYYGTVGEGTIIKHCKILKDVKIGDYAYIKGANKIKNLTVNSNADARTQIGEGVELVNGIIGYGCRVFYGVKAVRFVMGSNSHLKYGARLINSFLGDNATISCCEVLNTFIYPGHEQHHNNSFLCAATIMGQSNMAAGATIGSNHNSRGNDGEIICGRGFWPGLCVSLKHNSKFASYTLLAKGDYPAELNIKLPFSLVINDSSENTLKIMPTYWFGYNMYAIARNSWKYKDRDKRYSKEQLLEFDYLAPDTIEEIFEGIALMEKWASLSNLHNTQGNDSSALGRQLLNDKRKASSLMLRGYGIEASKRPVIILKPYDAYQTYIQLIVLYATRELVMFCLREGITTFDKIQEKVTPNEDFKHWVNLGGQLMTAKTVEDLKQKVKSGEINSWDALHKNYEKIGNAYNNQKVEHAFYALQRIVAIRGEELNNETFSHYVEQGVLMNNRLAQGTYDSRKKDYDNPYRQMVYDSVEEMEAVVGKLEDNSFIEYTINEAKAYEKKACQFLKVKKIEVIE